MTEPIISKRCSKCKQVKPTSEFYKNHTTTKDGYNCHCKACCSNYRKSGKGKIAQERYQKKWRQTEQCKAAKKRYNRTVKGKARAAVGYAVFTNILPKITTLKCKCGKQAKNYHHHKGYYLRHQLDVIPVCFECHYIYNHLTLCP